MQAEKAGSRLILGMCPFRPHTVTDYTVPTGNLDSGRRSHHWHYTAAVKANMQRPMRKKGRIIHACKMNRAGLIRRAVCMDGANRVMRD